MFCFFSRGDATEFLKDPTSYSEVSYSELVMPVFMCWISREVTHTFPIISKCSCLLKSMAFPLKNHLNLGFRDESLETSQGRTRLCPAVTSKLRGGTVILVGSTLKNRKEESHSAVCSPGSKLALYEISISGKNRIISLASLQLSFNRFS